RVGHRGTALRAAGEQSYPALGDRFGVVPWIGQACRTKEDQPSSPVKAPEFGLAGGSGIHDGPGRRSGSPHLHTGAVGLPPSATWSLERICTGGAAVARAAPRGELHGRRDAQAGQRGTRIL